MVVDNKLEAEKKYASPGHGGTPLRGFKDFIATLEATIWPHILATRDAINSLEPRTPLV
jgi:hypothetical protein